MQNGVGGRGQGGPRVLALSLGACTACSGPQGPQAPLQMENPALPLRSAQRLRDQPRTVPRTHNTPGGKLGKAQEASARCRAAGRAHLQGPGPRRRLPPHRFAGEGGERAVLTPTPFSVRASRVCARLCPPLTSDTVVIVLISLPFLLLLCVSASASLIKLFKLC